MRSLLTGKRRTIPFAAPIIKPVGPFLEMVQPGTGSFQAEVTATIQSVINSAITSMILGSFAMTSKQLLTLSHTISI
jgi:hypothetical protein